MDGMSEKQISEINDIEIQLLTDMYNRITESCTKKCIIPTYKSAELTKGEAVCLDRCTSKYLEISEKIGKKLTDIAMQDVNKVQSIQGQQPA